MGFSREEYWSGLPFPSPGYLSDPGIEPRSPAFPEDALPSKPPGKPYYNIYGRTYYIIIASQVALVVKNLSANAGDTRDTDSIPESGRSPGGGPGNPLQYPYLENPMDRRAWPATVHRVAKNRTQLKPLSISYYILAMFWDFQVAGWLSGKESTCYCREHQRPGFYPWVRKIPWRRKWQPIPVFLPGKIPWTEEPGSLQSMGLQRVGQNLVTKQQFWFV